MKYYGFRRPRLNFVIKSDAIHVTLDTRLPLFSACNIEKLGGAWGRGYARAEATLYGKKLFHAAYSVFDTLFLSLLCTIVKT